MEVIRDLRDGVRGKARAESLARAGIFPMLLLVLGVLAFTPEGLSAETSNTAASAEETNAAVIPLPKISPSAESAQRIIDAAAADLGMDQLNQKAEQELPTISQDIKARLEEDSRLLANGPTLNMLRRLSSDWDHIHNELSDWRRNLEKRSKEIESTSQRLKVLDQTWNATRQYYQTSNIPPEVLQRVTRISSSLNQAVENARSQQGIVAALQNQVSEDDVQVNQAVASIAHARREAFNNLFVQGIPPLWSAKVWTHSAGKVANDSQRSFARQNDALTAYVVRVRERFVLHGLMLLLLVISLLLARWKMRGQVEQQPALKHASVIFEAPVATAMVLALLASGWFYPGSPRLFQAILGAATVVPALMVLRRLIAPQVFPILNALVLFYFVDQVRLLLASQPLLSRLAFVLEMLAAACFAWYALRQLRLLAAATPDKKRAWRLTIATVWIMLGTFIIAFAANILGYSSLSRLIGHIVLSSAYLSLILYAVVRILDGLILSALSVPPLARLGVVAHHRDFLHQRAWKLLVWIAVIFWTVFLLEALSLRDPLLQDFKGLSAANLKFGTHQISIGDVFLFVFAVWLAFTVSRICRFVLEEEVYPRVHLAPGLHYSINKVVHYAILLVGFFAGVSLLGFDLSKLTILAGAFSVGLGFGLQAVINNFVCGIILLFERPIKIGDVIQIDGTEGEVERIGIRASIIRTMNGSAIIMPNGKLISDPVTNWTFTKRQRIIVLPVKVAAGTDPAKIGELLKSVAAANSAIVSDPPPQALVTDISGGALIFELRAATSATDDWPRVRSELAIAVYSALVAQKISAA